MPNPSTPHEFDWTRGDPPDPEVFAHAAGYVLAGGRSSRMGSDKALLELDGETLTERALRKLRIVCPEVLIAGGSPRLERFARVIPDEEPGRGPLGGIVAALAQSRFEWNLFLAVDVPFIPVEALKMLLLAAAGLPSVGVIAELHGQRHALSAVYSRAALPILRSELERGNGRVMTAIQAAGTVKFLQFDAVCEGQNWFRNLNTPEEFAAAGPPPTPRSS